MATSSLEQHGNEAPDTASGTRAKPSGLGQPRFRYARRDRQGVPSAVSHSSFQGMSDGPIGRPWDPGWRPRARSPTRLAPRPALGACPDSVLNAPCGHSRDPAWFPKADAVELERPLLAFPTIASLSEDSALRTSGRAAPCGPSMVPRSRATTFASWIP